MDASKTAFLNAVANANAAYDTVDELTAAFGDNGGPQGQQIETDQRATLEFNLVLGLVGPVLLPVIHPWPEESEQGEPVGRIISARKATAHERKAYEEGDF
jgi:hypothetical protein